MFRRSLILLGLGVAAVALAQDRPLTWNPQSEPFPHFKIGKDNPNNPFGAVWNRLGPRKQGACSIPLLQAQPKAHTPIAQMRPKQGQGTIRMAEPPAPPCEDWIFKENELILIRPRDKRE